VHHVAFVVPWGAVWSLPLYELALMTATYVEERSASVQIQFLTPEEEPLQVFGQTASEEMRRLLDRQEIEFHACVSATAFANGELWLVPEGRLSTDRVVALPRLQGTPLDGIPQMSLLPGISRTPRSNRAGWRRSRPTRPPRRSRPGSAWISGPRPSVRF
jgi:hypothetical protein